MTNSCVLDLSLAGSILVRCMSTYIKLSGHIEVFAKTEALYEYP